MYLKQKGLEELKIGKSIESLKKITTIELNDYNKVNHSILTDEKIAEDYFYLLRFYIKYDVEGLYNKLDKEYRNNKFKNIDEFKANYFTNEDAFIKYAEETFDIGNTIDFVQYTEATNLCTYKITLKGENKELTKTIIMKLEENTNFVMSFNVD